jgi:hypothetical protein
MAGKKRWIKGAVAGGKGKLHAHLGIPAGDKIPAAKLEAATHSSNPTIRREANLAETLKGFNKPGRARKALYGKDK